MIFTLFSWKPATRWHFVPPNQKSNMNECSELRWFCCWVPVVAAASWSFAQQAQLFEISKDKDLCYVYLIGRNAACWLVLLLLVVVSSRRMWTRRTLLIRVVLVSFIWDFHHTVHAKLYYDLRVVSGAEYTKFQIFSFPAKIQLSRQFWNWLLILEHSQYLSAPTNLWIHKFVSALWIHEKLFP